MRSRTTGFEIQRRLATVFAAFRRFTAPNLHARRWPRSASKNPAVGAPRCAAKAIASARPIRRDDAQRWAADAERTVDTGERPRKSRIARLNTFGHLIDLHIADIKEVGKAPGRTKIATLTRLKLDLGDKKLAELDREGLLAFGRRRAREDAGPVTVGTDIGAIKLALSHAAAIHGLSVKTAGRRTFIPSPPTIVCPGELPPVNCKIRREDSSANTHSPDLFSRVQTVTIAILHVGL